MSGWIGVDLDGTLAHYDGWKGARHIGKPVGMMLSRVKQWLAEGKTVKIFTARVAGHGQTLLNGEKVDAIGPIKAWCKEHIGTELEVTNVKDFGMVELWDDRAVQVEHNTGWPVVNPFTRFSALASEAYQQLMESTCETERCPEKAEATVFLKGQRVRLCNLCATSVAAKLEA